MSREAAECRMTPPTLLREIDPSEAETLMGVDAEASDFHLVAMWWRHGAKGKAAPQGTPM
jgi:hypothetical protein